MTRDDIDDDTPTEQKKIKSFIINEQMKVMNRRNFRAN